MTPFYPLLYQILHENSKFFARFACILRNLTILRQFYIKFANFAFKLHFCTLNDPHFWESTPKEPHFFVPTPNDPPFFEQGGPVKLDSMWQHRLTRPLHVQHTYYRIIFKQNPLTLFQEGCKVAPRRIFGWNNFSHNIAVIFDFFFYLYLQNHV